MKHIYLLVFSLLLCTVSMQAQDKTVSGTISDELGPLFGVNVTVKGSQGLGTTSDLDGKYMLKVPEGSETLIFSYLGYETKEMPIGGGGIIDMTMAEDVLRLSEVVVTALGVSRNEKSVGYAVQDLDGDEFTQAREANIINSLSGKVAGVQINSSSGSVGASSRILLRGASSITGNNDPLFVVDGVPIDNSNYGNAGSGGGVDQPNGVADINPDDIETISVLKGPNAANLYGLRAANGVVLITTKKGSKNQKGIGISVNSSTTFERPLVLPDFQNSYGQGPDRSNFVWVDGQTGDGGVDESWGPPLDVGLNFVQWDSYTRDGAASPWVSNPDNIRDFFETGLTLNNNVSLTGGNKTASFRLSGGFMDQKGMVPNTDFKKYNLSGASSLILAERLTANISVNYIKSQADNLPTVGYNNENPVQQMIWSGRQVDFNKLKDYENLPLAAEGTAAEGTPINWNTLYQNNPYWVLHTNLNGLDKDRIIGNVNLNYKINDMFDITAQTGTDTWSSKTSNQKGIGSNENPNGFYREINRRFTELNTQLLLGFNKELTNTVGLSLSIGGNRMTQDYNRVIIEAQQLELPGLYNVSNIKSGVSPVLTNRVREEQINSLLGFGQLSFRNAIFLDFSARNDWASMLPKDNNSFFYPSVSLSAVVSDLLELNSNAFSFLKVRAGYGVVGSTGILRAYELEQTFSYRDDPWGAIGLPYNPGSLNNPNLKPETQKGYEFGVDARLFRGRVRLDATYYDQNNQDLILQREVSAASGYIQALDNVGEMRNRGIELLLGFTPLKRQNMKLDIDFNFAKNTNEVVSVGDDAETLIIPDIAGNPGGQWGMTLQAIEGEPYGAIVGNPFLRDDSGNIVHDNGIPVVDPNQITLGNITPDWTGGVTGTLTVGGFNIGATIDAKMGGDIFSMSNTWGRYAGVLQETLIGREVGIVGEGVKNIGTDDEPNYVANDVVVDAETYNKGAFVNAVHESSVFDASFVKFRQLVIGYNLPTNWFKNAFFQKASVSLVGRNLAILHRNAPHIDPESAFSSGNSNQGQEFGQLPSARSIGFNINLKF